MQDRENEKLVANFVINELLFGFESYNEMLNPFDGNLGEYLSGLAKVVSQKANLEALGELLEEGFEIQRRDTKDYMITKVLFWTPKWIQDLILSL